MAMYEGTYETDGKEFSYEVGNNVLTATRHDPYGFWRFSFRRGAIPQELYGDFSSDYRARQAAEVYIQRVSKEKEKSE